MQGDAILKSWDHPRVCGEQDGQRRVTLANRGSPPRVRGTAHSLAADQQIPRITPACAGNRIQGVEKLVVGWDHPRVCGEQSRWTMCPRWPGGSPPRVRGTVQISVHLVERHRITPACAGNSISSANSINIIWDHPRVCGEQRRRPWKWGCLRGSPPRVRGTAIPAMLAGARKWITPACAGNSFMAYSSAMLTQDHPRVCGEQHTLATTAGGAGGSPPRVRGTAVYLSLIHI